MNKQRITITAFIFKLGDDYLGFLRNLTPTVLFLSLAFFGLPELENPNWSLEKVGMVLFSLGSLFIAISAMAVNIVSFAKKALKALQELQNIEVNTPLSFWQTVKLFWQEGNAKVVMFFFVINIVAIMMVMTYGMNYAFNFYRTISSMVG